MIMQTLHNTTLDDFNLAGVFVLLLLAIFFRRTL